MMKYKTQLQIFKNEEMVNFFTKSLADLEVLKKELETFTHNKTVDDFKTPSERMHYALYKCKLNDTIAKIESQSLNLETYESRQMEYEEIFERQSAQANEHWEAIMAKTKEISASNPMSELALSLQSFEETMKQLQEAYPDQPKVWQDLKNGFYQRAFLTIQKLEEKKSK